MFMHFFLEHPRAETNTFFSGGVLFYWCTNSSTGTTACPHSMNSGYNKIFNICCAAGGERRKPPPLLS